MSCKFDMNEALKRIKAGAQIEGKNRVLAPLIKQLTEAALEAELEVPRDRNGTFEPQIVKKHQRTLSDQIEQKILSLYAL